jgi:glycosyltransferase involved in cell wall biosynthesis
LNTKLKLICTRSLEKVYDHSTIIKALAILKHTNKVDFHMTFIGGGTLMPQLKQEVEVGDLTDHVDFVGRVENDKLPQILSEHDIYISASLRDGTSICLLEAMANGLFPVVSRIKANTVWLEDGVNGLMFEVGNANQLANLIMQLRDNPSLYTAAARHNRQKVVEHGNRKTNMKLLEQVYKELLYARDKICCEL